MSSTSRVDLAFTWVSDLGRAVDWYRTVLGVAPGDPAGEWQPFPLASRPTFALHGAVPGGSAGTVVGFRVEDLDAAVERLGIEGIVPVGGVTDLGTLRFVEYDDPDGNRIQLIERAGSAIDGGGFETLLIRLADAWAKQDVEAAVACFTPDAIYMEPPDEQLFQGHDALRRYFEPLRPGTYLRMDALWFDEERQRGAVEFTFGEGGSADADHGVAIIDVGDGRIARWREFLRRGPADLSAFNATTGKRWRWSAENYP